MTGMLRSVISTSTVALEDVERLPPLAALRTS
jgi:hypothetical protein